MTNEEIIAKLDSRIRDSVRKFLEEAKKVGFSIRITSGIRTPQEQQTLYNQGRTTPGKIVTNAKGLPVCESIHCSGLAFDVVDRVNGYNIDWERLGRLGEGLGFEWGGRWISFVDKPHFQKIKFESVIIPPEDDVITDSTKIDLGSEVGTMEVQAIRSTIRDLRRDNDGLRSEMNGLESDITNLQAQIITLQSRLNTTPTVTVSDFKPISVQDAWKVIIEFLKNLLKIT